MSTGRFATPGKTRSCPHCRATILDSAAVCPGCNHHLRFDSSGANQRAPAVTPLRVEGTLRHASGGGGGAWEYSVVLAIRNERGEEIARQIVGVGALQPSESRTFTLAVEVFKPAEVREPKPQVLEPAARGALVRPPDSRAPVRPGTPGGRGEPLRPPALPGSEPGRPGAALPQAGPTHSQPGSPPPRPGSPPSRPGSTLSQPGSPPPRPGSPPARPGSTHSQSASPVAQPGMAPAKAGVAPAQPAPVAAPVKPSAPSPRLPFSRTPFLGRGK